ncbi:MAG: aminopeptidase [Gemmatimonadota bacterium]
MKRSRLRMGLLIAAATLLLGYGTAYVASSEVRYLSRAGIEETRLLTGRIPITALARDTTVPDSIRAMANLVVDVRGYAARLGLDAKETYTSYSDVGRDTLLLVLTASPKNCLCPVMWRYPIAGRVPYKGFFDFDEGKRAASSYAIKSYDVNLRPSAAFSTLGWFNDPLLSTALTRDSVELAALVFHEIAHNTIWVKGATDFNESFAQWVGYRAAEEYFLARGDTALSFRAGDRWHDEQVLGDYYGLLLGKLDSLYALKLPDAENEAGRAIIARWSADTLTTSFGQSLRTIRVARFAERPINNAALLGVRLYRTELPLFSSWDRAYRGDLTRALYTLGALLEDAKGSEAFDRMRAMVKTIRPIGNPAAAEPVPQ